MLTLRHASSLTDDKVMIRERFVDIAPNEIYHPDDYPVDGQGKGRGG